MSKTVHPVQFKKEISGNQGISMVRFCSEKDLNCRSLNSYFSQLESYYQAYMRFYTINTDLNRQMVREFNIHDLPAILLFRNGVVVDHFSGKDPVAGFHSRISELLKSKRTMKRELMLL